MENTGRARQRSGRLGEALAAWFLERRGYRILDRNARIGRFEIDLVAERGCWLVFVEVKFRRATAWGTVRRSLTERQRLRLAAGAAAYASRWARGRQIRFDLVWIEEGEERLAIEHLPDAFGAHGVLR